MIKFFSREVKSKGEAWLHLHLAVFLFGFTAILGRLISLPGPGVVWYRMLLAVLTFCLVPGLVFKVIRMPVRQLILLSQIGALICVHWVCFFAAIKYSNVSVTLCCLSTGSFFTAIFEPFVLKKKIKWFQLALGSLMVPGIYLIYSFSDAYVVGIVLGISAAAIAAFFSVLNKKLVANKKQDLVAMTLAELTAGWLFLTPLLPVYYHFFPDQPFIPQPLDWVWLLILAVICTCVAFVSSLKALKVLSAFTVNLTINLEPVYGIIIAMPLFAEYKEVGPGFWAGMGIVLLVVFVNPFLEKYFSRKQIQ